LLQEVSVIAERAASSPVRVGEDTVFVIAEAGSNWRMGTAKRDLAMGTALIDVAVEAGADAVKFQTYRPETVYVPNAGTSQYLSEAGIEEDISEIFADLAMPYEMLAELAERCRRNSIQFMSTPFSPADFAAVDPWVAVHKNASYEISHLRLIELAARSGKPLIQSTGAATVEDIAWAVDTFRENDGGQLLLLQCTARYPAPLSAIDVRAIPWLAERFGVAAGLSDHSRDPLAAPLAAVALGARVIEKHYTLHNGLPGPDHSFALEPAELRAMVTGIRHVEAVLGESVKRVRPEEEELRSYAQRAIQAILPIASGETLREDHNIAIRRAGQQRKGLHPRFLGDIEGRQAARDIPLGDGIQSGDWLA
jgi:sialic acid synthase SpsE